MPVRMGNDHRCIYLFPSHLRVNKTGAGAALECHQTRLRLPKLRLRKGTAGKAESQAAKERRGF